MNDVQQNDVLKKPYPKNAKFIIRIKLGKYFFATAELPLNKKEEKLEAF